MCGDLNNTVKSLDLSESSIKEREYVKSCFVLFLTPFHTSTVFSPPP